MPSISINHYNLNRYARVRMYFTDTGGNPIDPTTIDLFIENEYSTGGPTLITKASSMMLHPSTGLFLYDSLVNATGGWDYRVQTGGNVVLAGQGKFYGIRPTATTST